jgi:aminoglycoside 6'-N-acetyltransferase
MLSGRHVVLRPLAASDGPRLREIHDEPAVSAWWGELDPGFPDAGDAEVTRFSVLLDGEVVGLVQFSEEPDPDYRHAAIDVFVAAAHQGRGLGTDAVQTLAWHLIEARGHHRITIDPAADNAAAVRSYEKAGFRPVGVMRSSWRDRTGAWRDVLLMELVVSPQT